MLQLPSTFTIFTLAGIFVFCWNIRLMNNNIYCPTINQFQSQSADWTGIRGKHPDNPGCLMDWKSTELQSGPAVYQHICLSIRVYVQPLILLTRRFRFNEVRAGFEKFSSYWHHFICAGDRKRAILPASHWRFGCICGYPTWRGKIAGRWWGIIISVACIFPLILRS